MTLLDNLVETGLTRHEAQLYMMLSRDGAMSGYEAAKQTGISRSNSYIALAGLVSKGGAVLVDGDVARYDAVPIGEFCENKRRRLAQVLQEIQAEMPMRRAASEPFLTIRGSEHILNKMKNLIRLTEQRVYLSLAPDELGAVFPELEKLVSRGKKVVLITEPPFDLSGATVYHAGKKPGQIRLIVDSSIVLTGEIAPDKQEESSCLYSRHQALVSLFKESMMNEISLIRASMPLNGTDSAGQDKEGRINL